MFRLLKLNLLLLAIFYSSTCSPSPAEVIDLPAHNVWVCFIDKTQIGAHRRPELTFSQVSSNSSEGAQAIDIDLTEGKNKAREFLGRSSTVKVKFTQDSCFKWILANIFYGGPYEPYMIIADGYSYKYVYLYPGSTFVRLDLSCKQIRISECVREEVTFDLDAQIKQRMPGILNRLAATILALYSGIGLSVAHGNLISKVLNLNNSFNDAALLRGAGLIAFMSCITVLVAAFAPEWAFWSNAKRSAFCNAITSSFEKPVTLSFQGIDSPWSANFVIDEFKALVSNQEQNKLELKDYLLERSSKKQVWPYIAAGTVFATALLAVVAREP